jgi:hypothetical protein
MAPAASTLFWQALGRPKRGHAADEYEDAWAANARAGRFAIADGASESSYAALWARLLTETFVGLAQWPGMEEDWLAAPRRRWAESTGGLNLPWYAEAKQAQGAFATLLGVTAEPGSEGRPGKWRALAVGDSCLFRVRGGRLSRAFPVGRSTDFDNRPRLVGSRDGPALKVEKTKGSLEPGDRLFLMTDALAQWFLDRTERGERPWEVIESLLADADPPAAFAAWVEDRRDKDDLRNDDVTLLAVGLTFLNKE